MLFEGIIAREAQKIRLMMYDYDYVCKQYTRFYNAYETAVINSYGAANIRNYYIMKEAFRIVKEEMEGYTWKTNEK